MKPILKIIDTQQHEAFQMMKVEEAYFFPSWHFHPEFEIMLVQEGAGMRFVGDSMERFQPGDLVLFGSGIPHLFRSDQTYYEKDSDLISRAIVVYFKENFLGESFWELPQVTPLKKLLALAKRGIRFTGASRDALAQQIKRLDEEKNGISRIIDLLSILNRMADSREFELLSSTVFTKSSDEKECERMNRVYQFIIDNYTRNPSLEEVSGVANLSVTAFCRYFKSHTNKTYTQFLNEIKIGNACKLLIDKELSISQICYETGFNNFTHFNGQFKRIVGSTPKQYQHAQLKLATFTAALALS
ncbi:MAG: AraC family transcriptional regulator [Cytophagaceae bacterium]|nr:AraC family transcriptional regulator [Cytophagaceae bacterium]